MRHMSIEQIRAETEADVQLFGKKSAQLPLNDAMRILAHSIYGAVKEFPNYEKRGGLATEITSSLWELQELILTARAYQRQRVTESRHRAQIGRLERISVRYDVLKMQIRTAVDRRYICFDVYEKLAKHLVFVGRQVGGWLRDLRAKGAAL